MSAQKLKKQVLLLDEETNNISAYDRYIVKLPINSRLQQNNEQLKQWLQITKETIRIFKKEYIQKMKYGQMYIRKYYKMKNAASEKQPIQNDKKLQNNMKAKLKQQTLRKFFLDDNQYKTHGPDIIRENAHGKKKFIQLDIRELFIPTDHSLLVNR